MDGSNNSNSSYREDNWKPRRCQNPWKPNMYHGQSEVYRRTLGILNRVTQQSLNVLLEQILELPIAEPEYKPSIIALLLSKSQDEPLFAPIYARLCGEICQYINFKEDLVVACRSHFSSNLQFLLHFNEVFEGSITLHDIEEELLARKRLIVHTGFVCELQRAEVVQQEQIVSMAEILLSHSDVRSLECLCRLLAFCGITLSNSHPSVVDRSIMKIENALTGGSLSPRLRFLAEDILNLQANGWRPRGGGGQGNGVHRAVTGGRNVRG